MTQKALFDKTHSSSDFVSTILGKVIPSKSFDFKDTACWDGSSNHRPRNLPPTEVVLPLKAP